MLPIDAVLMAGGKGERLRPLTEKTPKPLLEVGGKCIIDHNVDRLISYGVQHINVTVNYLGDNWKNILLLLVVVYRYALSESLSFLELSVVLSLWILFTTIIFL